MIFAFPPEFVGGARGVAVNVLEETTFQKAITALQAGKLKDAEPLLRAVLGLRPTHVGALNLLGAALMQFGRFDEAEIFLRRALEQQGHSDATLYNYGLLLKFLGRPAEALEQFTRALKINPSAAETWNSRGTVFNDLMRYQDAIGDFDRAVAIDSRYAEALCNKGKSLTMLERFHDALSAYVSASTLKPQLIEAWLGRGNVCLKLKQYEDALAAYDAALKLNPGLTEAWIACAGIFTERKQYDAAIAAFDRAIAARPDLAAAWLGRGNACEGLARHDEALAAFDRSLALQPSLAEAWYCRGIVLFRVKRYEEAFAALEEALAQKPDFAEAWVGRGELDWQLKRYEEAFAAFEEALALNPNLASAWLGRGNVSYDIRHGETSLDQSNDKTDSPEYTEILSDFDRALSLKPDLAEAWLGRGNVLCDLESYQAAQSAYDQALALRPELAEAWLGRGNVLRGLGYYQQAQLAFDRALALKPDAAKALSARGTVFTELKEYDKAAADFERALALDSNLKYARGQLLYAKLHLADWANVEAEISATVSAVREDKSIVTPFTFGLVSFSPSDQMICAERFNGSSISFPRLWSGEIYAHERIRIAYLSADFRNHPVAQLMVGLFEQHDRSRFHTIGLSVGPDDGSTLRRRLESAFDEFVDVQHMSDEEIARHIRDNEIDIVVDLMAFTSGSRVNVLARRPSPVQVNYLGYPGTMGADFMDYIIADQTVIPEEHLAFYSEQVVWLPDCFQPNDAGRDISERKATRTECQLPEQAFVFCCFNNAAKILPETFDVWMRLLAAKDKSVIWLHAPHPTAVQNLRRETERRGISPDRLIFAPKTPLLADHLARLGNADLFLDTLPYNAHTTASDALWAGVPLLTCLGSSYATRVAASVLKAVGLAELITSSLREYESLALALANDPDRLRALRARLALNRTTHPLFDTARFTRHIESAYTTMWRRYQRGEAPQAFAVSRIG